MTDATFDKIMAVLATIRADLDEIKLGMASFGNSLSVLEDLCRPMRGLMDTEH